MYRHEQHSEFSEDDDATGSPMRAHPSSMRVVIVGCAIVAVLSWFSDRPSVPQAHAQAVLDAPPCEGARRDLDTALAQPLPANPDEQVRLKLQIEKNRGIVAERCLGREGAATVDSRAAARAAARPPAEVGPLRVEPTPPAAAAVVVAPAMAPPPVEVGRPTFTTVCDPGGCWDSSGTRLNGSPAGPMQGPRGTCTTSATGVVNCF